MGGDLRIACEKWEKGSQQFRDLCARGVNGTEEENAMGKISWRKNKIGLTKKSLRQLEDGSKVR